MCQIYCRRVKCFSIQQGFGDIACCLGLFIFPVLAIFFILYFISKNSLCYVKKFRETWLNILFVIHQVMLIHSSKRIKLLLIPNNTSTFDLPTRLLQSAGNITTSKITAFLEHIYKPISIKFCESGVN